MQVRSVPVETRAIPLSQLAVPPPSVQEINSVEASLRLDALASAGVSTRPGLFACLLYSLMMADD
jgi:RNA-binding protein YlmH